MTFAADEFSALMERARHGDEGALTGLAERYAPVLQRAARGLLGHVLRTQLDSVDLVQSVHRTLLIGLRDAKFDVSSPDKLIALAMTLLRRKVARHWRTLKRQTETGCAKSSADAPGPPADPVDPAQEDPAGAALFRD